MAIGNEGYDDYNMYKKHNINVWKLYCLEHSLFSSEIYWPLLGSISASLVATSSSCSTKYSQLARHISLALAFSFLITSLNTQSVFIGDMNE